MTDPSRSRYQVERPLAVGGGARVFLARDTERDRLVALKVINSEVPDDVRERLRQRALQIQRLDHPHIVSILDVTEHDGRFALALALVEGESVSRLRGRDQWPCATAVTWITEFASALAYAHQEGIAHERLSPVKLMIDSGGHVRLLGFASFARAAEERSAPVGHVTSSLTYLSPEQIRGETPTRESDCFSFGTVCYEILTGRRAFPGGGTEVLMRVLDGRFEPLPVDAPGLNADVVKTVERCLQTDPARRPTMKEVLRALEASA